MQSVSPSASPAPAPIDTRRVWWFFGVDCLIATVLRLGLAWWSGGYRTDVLTFQSWADTLRTHPLGHFYATATSPDHLPGDLWFLKLTVTAYDGLGGSDVYGPTFAFLTQVIPTVGDLLTGLMLFLIARRIADAEIAGSCARWYLLNPATIILTGVWGQWDSVSLGLLLTGAWLCLSERWWVASAPFFAWTVLIKPQLALAVACFVVLLAARLWSEIRSADEPRPGGVRDLAWRGVAWVVLGLVTAYALLAPFGVRLFGGHGNSLLDRVQVALGLYPDTTLGAANVWMLPIGGLDRVRDDVPGWLGVTPQNWGLVLLLVATAYVALICATRLRGRDSISTALWAATALSMAAFLLSTRVHERYALPVLGLGLAWGARERLPRWFAVWVAILSTCLTLNMILVLYGGLTGPGGQTLSFGPPWWITLSAVYCGLGLALLAWPWLTPRPPREAPPRALASSSTQRSAPTGPDRG